MVAAQQLAAAAMSAYVRTRFRLRVFGLEQLRLEPGTIVTPNHRSDADVPVLVSALVAPWSQAVTGAIPWPTFAARDHAFFPGFFAGYPVLPLGARRLLWPARVGGLLEHRLQCVPMRDPARMRVVELLRYDPDQELEGRLPSDICEALARRADRLGLERPRHGRDVLNGRFADIVWTELARDATTGYEDIWRWHLRLAVLDFQRLGTALRAGGLVVIFPEGRLIPDGELGPLAAGVSSLVRRGRARLVQPVAISYDRLTAGRPRAYVSVAPVVAAAPGVREAIAANVRRAIPLTAGQIAAVVLRRGGSRSALSRAGHEWVSRAREVGRPMEPLLSGPLRTAALAHAFWQAERRGPDHPIVAGLARELAAANE
jgi:hypothetical protein